MGLISLPLSTFIFHHMDHIACLPVDKLSFLALPHVPTQSASYLQKSCLVPHLKAHRVALGRIWWIIPLTSSKKAGTAFFPYISHQSSDKAEWVSGCFPSVTYVAAMGQSEHPLKCRQPVNAVEAPMSSMNYSRIHHVSRIVPGTMISSALIPYNIYSRLPYNPYTLVDCSGYGVSGSMDSEKRPNKGQTNKILFKNLEKRSEDRYTMLVLLRLPECVTMRLESLSRRLNIILFYCYCR